MRWENTSFRWNRRFILTLKGKEELDHFIYFSCASYGRRNTSMCMRIHWKRIKTQIVIVHSSTDACSTKMQSDNSLKPSRLACVTFSPSLQFLLYILERFPYLGSICKRRAVEKQMKAVNELHIGVCIRSHAHFKIKERLKDFAPISGFTWPVWWIYKISTMNFCGCTY